ncbi:hypothetical protein GF382_01410 [Candidatus Falkowbacteria bacterium]|nr:hypothetical protein [Candidatus Falkowbacteria bacterium]
MLNKSIVGLSSASISLITLVFFSGCPLLGIMLFCAAMGLLAFFSGCPLLGIMLFCASTATYMITKIMEAHHAGTLGNTVWQQLKALPRLAVPSVILHLFSSSAAQKGSFSQGVAARTAEVPANSRQEFSNRDQRSPEHKPMNPEAYEQYIAGITKADKEYDHIRGEWFEQEALRRNASWRIGLEKGPKQKLVATLEELALVERENLDRIERVRQIAAENAAKRAELTKATGDGSARLALLINTHRMLDVSSEDVTVKEEIQEMIGISD